MTIPASRNCQQTTVLDHGFFPSAVGSLPRQGGFASPLRTASLHPVSIEKAPTIRSSTPQQTRWPNRPTDMPSCKNANRSSHGLPRRYSGHFHPSRVAPPPSAVGLHFFLYSRSISSPPPQLFKFYRRRKKSAIAMPVTMPAPKLTNKDLAGLCRTTSSTSA